MSVFDRDEDNDADIPAIDLETHRNCPYCGAEIKVQGTTAIIYSCGTGYYAVSRRYVRNCND